MPLSYTDPLPKIYGTLENGKEIFLFEFYPNEIKFTGDEFTGLTVKQAKQKYEKLLSFSVEKIS